MVNPSGKEASFPYEGKLGQVVYCNGGEAKAENGQLTIGAASAVYVWEA